MRPTPVGLTLLAVVAMVGSGVSPAQAASTGTASVVEATTVQFKAAKGKQNRVVVTRSGKTVTIDDSVAVKAGKGCKKVKGDRTKVRCTPSKAPTRVRVYTYDRNDSVTNRSGLAISASGGTGSDQLFGGPLADRLTGGTGNDRISAGSGNDRLSGDDGTDYLYGGAGHDQIIGGGSADVLHGGADNDVLSGGYGNDKLSGDSGDDSLFGDHGSDRLAGDSGNDVLAGDSGQSTVSADVLLGGSGRDTADYRTYRKALTVDLDGASRDDGQAGERDTVGADVEDIRGGPGADRLTGNASGNRIVGLAGDDVIRGGAGNDRLEGDSGRDLLYGEEGEDMLDSGGHGDGPDTLDGGPNATVAGDNCQVREPSDIQINCEYYIPW
ncbi:calcium-binding protein [Actinoplanes sp. NPDC024001]|uniref:calcium-binding protein n=1 Tax=Actinoplanes sp. NPDC024001 TaxID=3154598 RepID=UPI0033C9CF40